MIKLALLKQENLKYSWKTIYIGLQYGLFDYSVLKEYSLEVMEEGEDTELINDLAWGIEEEDLALYLMNIKVLYFPELEEDDSEWNKEFRKLRYVKMLSIRNNNVHNKEILDRVATLYDEMNYPEDMVYFINYMPQDEITTEEELIKNMDDFLKKEKDFLEDLS